MRSATLRQLRVFASAATHLSFARAAAELHLTAPAVSLQIAELERHAGLPLFERLGKRVYLTAAGEAMRRASDRHPRPAARARGGARRAARRGGRAAQRRRDQRRRLLLPDAAERLLRAPPGRAGGARRCATATSCCAASTATRWTSASWASRPGGGEFEAVEFATNPLVIIAPPQHPLAGREAHRARRAGRASASSRASTARSRAGDGRGAAARAHQARHRDRGREQRDAQAGGLGGLRHRLHVGARHRARGRGASASRCSTWPTSRSAARWYCVHRRGKRLPAGGARLRGVPAQRRARRGCCASCRPP